MVGLFARLDRLLCGMKGHAAMLQYGDGRVWLACAVCGWESPGWQVTPQPKAPKVRSMNLLFSRDTRARKIA